MSFVKIIEPISLRPVPSVSHRPRAADELFAVIVAFEIRRVLMAEFPESPYPVPMPEPKLEDDDNDDDDELIAVIIAFEIVRVLMVELPE
jgi:hypothetical protein